MNRLDAPNVSRDRRANSSAKAAGLLLAPLVLFFANRPAAAATINLSGADLLTYPGVVFPTDQPTQVGSSLRWAAGGSSYAKMFELPLPAVSVLDTVQVTMNLTRLTLDHDVYIMASDGSNMLGALAGDDNGGELLSERFVDAGNTGSRDGADLIFINAGYPEIGESFTVNVGFSFTPTSTTVSGAFNAGSGQFTSTSRFLVPSSGLKLVFMRDNDSVEQYQINSLSVTVPEPGSMIACLAALLPLRRARSRQRQ